MKNNNTLKPIQTKKSTIIKPNLLQTTNTSLNTTKNSKFSNNTSKKVGQIFESIKKK